MEMFVVRLLFNAREGEVVTREMKSGTTHTAGVRPLKSRGGDLNLFIRKPWLLTLLASLRCYERPLSRVRQSLCQKLCKKSGSVDPSSACSALSFSPCTTRQFFMYRS